MTPDSERNDCAMNHQSLNLFNLTSSIQAAAICSSTVSENNRRYKIDFYSEHYLCLFNSVSPLITVSPNTIKQNALAVRVKMYLSMYILSRNK